MKKSGFLAAMTIDLLGALAPVMVLAQAAPQAPAEQSYEIQDIVVTA
jgi:hypothetical protein